MCTVRAPILAFPECFIFYSSSNNIKLILNKTPYELFKGIRPSISYFYKFGCTCYILNNKVNLKKFDVKAQKGILLGYFECSKTYKVYNFETNTVEIKRRTGKPQYDKT